MRKSLLIPALLAFASLAAAADKAPSEAGPHKGPEAGAVSSERQAEARRNRGEAEAVGHLHRLLSLSDEQLARSRTVIEKVEKLTPAERADLRKRIDTLRDATPEARLAFAAEMREKLGLNPDDFHPKAGGEHRSPVRNLVEKHFSTLTPEQAKAERAKFLAMSREEKIAYLKSLREKYGLPEPAEGPKGPKGPHAGGRPGAQHPPAAPEKPSEPKP